MDNITIIDCARLVVISQTLYSFSHWL